MTAIRSSKLLGPLSIALAALMLVLAVPTATLPMAEAQAQGKLLLLFPVLDRSDSGYEDIRLRATDYLQMALSGVEGLRVLEFSRTSPLVLRAVDEGQIRSVDLETDVADPVTAIQIGYALGADEVCLATVASVDTAAQPIKVEVLMNGQCYDVASNIAPDTMQIAERPTASRSFGVTGVSQVRDGYAGTLPPLVREALRDAGQKAAQVLAGVSAEQVVERNAGKKQSKNWSWVMAALLVAGLVAAVTSGGGDDTGVIQPGALAPTPLRLEIEQSTIRLFWSPPNTTEVILRYDIQRSTDNGATFNPVPGSIGNVQPGDTSFADFDVTPGVSFVYRIRAQYAAFGPSDWAVFQSVEFPG